MTPLDARLAKHSVRDPATGCVEWVGRLSTQGYGTIKLEGKYVVTHRLTYELAYGTLPKNVFVCHRCDNRRCRELSHLFAGTADDNSKDMVAKGRQRVAKGELNSKARLTEPQVMDIFNSQDTASALSTIYNVSLQAVYDIRQGRTWAYLTNKTRSTT